MKKNLQILNILALLATIGVNSLSATGTFNGQTVAEVSNKYHTLFTPAGYAFSIWGLIYLMLAAFVIYQSIGLFKEVDDDGFILHIGWWFVISCLANSLWLIAWVFEWTGISVLVMAVLFFSLLRIVINTNMERWDAPLPKIFFLWWPFCLYAGWITLAFIANIAAYLQKTGWNGFGMGETVWAIVMIIAAGLINFFMIWSRNMREFALVGIWGLLAVAAANRALHASIVWIAVGVSIILFVIVAIHSFKNRATSPFAKMMS